MKKIHVGAVSQFGTKGYGFIEDKEGNKYFVHQKNVYNKTRLKVGSKVTFSVEETDKGLVAIEVKPFQTSSKFHIIPLLLAVSFVLHGIVLYAVFIK